MIYNSDKRTNDSPVLQDCFFNYGIGSTQEPTDDSGESRLI